MAEIGYGYGSEWQLLRALGHHREKFFEKLKEKLSIKGEIHWLDYPSDEKRISGDGEYVGIEFFKQDSNFNSKYDINKIQEKWKEFWAQQGNAQNWDGIFYDDDTIYLVEAKGHIEELKSSGTTSKDERIDKSLRATMQELGVDELKLNKWKGCYYQLANRLAFAHFLNKECKIKAKIVYVYFCNAWLNARYFDKENNNVNAEPDWKDAYRGRTY